MSLLKLRTAPVILIEDDANINILPLLLELVPTEKKLNVFCYEQPPHVWSSVFRNPNVKCHEEFDLNFYEKYTASKSTVVIDSINQMALCLGWNECLRNLNKLKTNPNIEQVIIILHTDCLHNNSKFQIHMSHISSAIISYDASNSCKIHLRIKRGSKVAKSEEILSYDTRTSTLKSIPVVKEERRDEEPVKPSPGTLSTFKIEVDQIDKMEKSKLKLPYMSKIHEGESKVYYEPDAVDDWDEEDPDEDLDI